MPNIKIVECPRDAMQGLHHFIPTEVKAEYINALLRIGFHTIDAGSFVSPKAIPQMRDTAEVLNMLDLTNTNTKLLTIVANKRGGDEAVQFEQVSYLGFPFSISETFQQRNTNSTLEQSLHTVEALQALCNSTGKELVIYISMAFGNPYGDQWNAGIAYHWIDKIASLGISTIALADTVGLATEEDVGYMFKHLIPEFTAVEFGAHLHCRADNWRKKLEAAYSNGCRRFDAALKGFGGCPMANDELIGNMATENLVEFLKQKGEMLTVDDEKLKESMEKAVQVFATLPAH